MSEARRDIKANLRDALAEAKDAIEGKRKLNTLDNLITELRETVDEGKLKEVEIKNVGADWLVDYH
jgi:hypothetical protein